MDETPPIATNAESPTLPGAAMQIDAADGATLPLPVPTGGTSLLVLTMLAAIFMLHWASAVFIPLMLGLTMTYALGPAVNRMQRWHIPRAIGAAMLMITLIGGVSWAGHALSDDATQFVESLPEAAQKIRHAVRAQRHQPGTALDKVQSAATQLEHAAKESAAPAPARGVTRVQIERAQFNLKDYLWSSMPGVKAVKNQIVVRP